MKSVKKLSRLSYRVVFRYINILIQSNSQHAKCVYDDIPYHLHNYITQPSFVIYVLKYAFMFKTFVQSDAFKHMMLVEPLENYEYLRQTHTHQYVCKTYGCDWDERNDDLNNFNINPLVLIDDDDFFIKILQRCESVKNNWLLESVLLREKSVVGTAA